MKYKIICCVVLVAMLIGAYTLTASAYSSTSGGGIIYTVRPTIDSNLTISIDDGIDRNIYNVPSVDISFDTTTGYEDIDVVISNPPSNTTYNLQKLNLNANNWYMTPTKDTINAYQLNRYLQLGNIKDLVYTADIIDYNMYYGNGQVSDTLVVGANDISTFNFGRIEFDLTYCIDKDVVVGPTNQTYSQTHIQKNISTTDVVIDNNNEIVEYNIGVIIANTIASQIDNGTINGLDADLPIKIENLKLENNSNIDFVSISKIYLSATTPQNNSTIRPKAFINDNGQLQIVYIDKDLNIDEVGTSLLGAVDGFLEFEIYPGITLINLLYVMVGISLVVILLKLYAGG